MKFVGIPRNLKKSGKSDGHPENVEETRGMRNSVESGKLGEIWQEIEEISKNAKKSKIL